MAKKTTPKKTSKKVIKKTVKKPVVKKKPVQKKEDKKKKPLKGKTVLKKVKKKLPVKTTKSKIKALPKKKVVKKAIKKLVKKVNKKVVKKVVAKAKSPIKKKTLKKVILPIKKAKIDKKIAPLKSVKKIEINKKAIVVLPKHNIVSIKNVQTEEANYCRADMFYKNVLKAEIIKRYSFKKPEDSVFIEKDQSLLIRLSDNEYTVSEKNRDQDWNDIYVEIFRKYPEEEGWIKCTQSDYLAYFFPGRIFWAKMESIKVLCEEILLKAKDSGIYKELQFMYPKNNGRLSKTFKINTKTYSFNFIQTYHEEGNQSYYSIGISLPFVLLMDFRIDYKIFKQ